MLDERNKFIEEIAVIYVYYMSSIRKKYFLVKIDKFFWTVMLYKSQMQITEMLQINEVV